MISALIEGPRHQLRGWFERGGWTSVWHVLYLAILICASATAVADREVSADRRAAIAALAALEVGWYVLIAVRWRYWESSPARFAVSMAVAGALWLPLLVWHPVFEWTIPAAYGVAACPWLRRSIPTLAVLSGLLVLADHLDGGKPVTVGRVSGVMAIGAIVLLAHATMGAIARESERRRRLILELESTRAELVPRQATFARFTSSRSALS